MTDTNAVDQAWLNGNSNVEEATALLVELVAIRSLPGEEGAVQRRVASWLSENGVSPQIVDVEPGRPNVTAVIENGTGPTLLLNGHVDTASIDPRWDQTRLFGRRDGDRFIG